MSRNTCRMTGMILMIISIFPIMAGLYLPDVGIDKPITVGSIIVGLLLFVAGIVFYKILQND